MSNHGTTEHDPRMGLRPHILPLKLYLAIGGALIIMTVITVWAAQVNLGHPAVNLAVALLIATIKASLVALFFMHLLYDNKLYLVTFLGALLFLAIFITLTLADTQRRGDIYPYRQEVRDHPTILGMRAPKVAHDAATTDTPTDAAVADTPAAH